METSLVQIKLLYFASLREKLGRTEEELEIKTGLTPEQVLKEIFPSAQDYESWRSCLRVAINQEYAPWDRPLQSGDEVTFIPPVAGG